MSISTNNVEKRNWILFFFPINPECKKLKYSSTKYNLFCLWRQKTFLDLWVYAKTFYTINVITSHLLCYKKLNQIAAKFLQDCPNMAQEAPRWTQVAPKTSQSDPNIAPTWPKIAPNGNKVIPRYCQDGINLAQDAHPTACNIQHTAYNTARRNAR